MKTTEEFQHEIAPFTWVELRESVSVCLNAGEYLQEVFDACGLEGSGYEWEGLARVFLEEKLPELMEVIEFDSEADMFCVYSKDTEALRQMIRRFKTVCEDRACILDLLSRAEPD